MNDPIKNGQNILSAILNNTLCFRDSPKGFIELRKVVIFPVMIYYSKITD